MSTSQVRIPAEERRQQILDLATELFARQGYQGTTTRQIAQQVRVNEAIIFRHFPTKEELYWAVIENQIRIRAGRARLEARLAAGGSDRDVLTAIAEELLSRDATLSRLLLYTALENHELTHRFFRTHVAQYLELLADFLRRGITEGRFREVDPLLAARGFLGMIVYHFQIQELFGGKRVQTFDPHLVSETLVDIWLHGMEVGSG
ncbi:MAG: TetR/AcrR family transcriptional regulator [Acidobacteriia bacterium]|nr:TetR/AcrR family transcriptional regulator [Terriglobia bacterium]